MSSSDIQAYRESIENDLKWRLEEIALLESRLNSFTITVGEDRETNEKNKNKYRKSLVVMLYSHFEGFFRFSFAQYADALNSLSIPLGKAVDSLVVSSLHIEFSKYDIENNWINKSDIDEISKSKRFINRVELIRNIIKLQSAGFVDLPIRSATDSNSIIYTESNLSPKVIDTILRQLGLENALGIGTTKADPLFGIVSQFIRVRNDIAHGDITYKDGLVEVEYNKIRKAFDAVVNRIPKVITSALINKTYFK